MKKEIIDDKISDKNSSKFKEETDINVNLSFDITIHKKIFLPNNDKFLFSVFCIKNFSERILSF